MEFRAQEQADKHNLDEPSSNCATRTHRNPAIFDIMAAEPVEEQKLDDPFVDVKAMRQWIKMQNGAISESALKLRPLLCL